MVGQHIFFLVGIALTINRFSGVSQDSIRVCEGACPFDRIAPAFETAFFIRSPLIGDG
jgi:hypothetical protein